MLPFGKHSTPPIKPNRNHFDLSHQNNLTMDYGGLYPCLCLPVIPGDSFKTSVAFGIRALPTAFPVQTRVRADVHFFYVRNRNLYTDWPNFIGQTGDTSKYSIPYLGRSQKLKHFKTGSLGDYLGLPSTIAGNRSNSLSVSDKEIDYVPFSTQWPANIITHIMMVTQLKGLVDNGVFVPGSSLINKYREQNASFQFLPFRGKRVTTRVLPGSDVEIRINIEASETAFKAIEGYTPYLVPCNVSNIPSSGNFPDAGSDKVDFTSDTVIYSPIDGLTAIGRTSLLSRSIIGRFTVGDSTLSFDSVCLIYLPNSYVDIPVNLLSVADYTAVKPPLTRVTDVKYSFTGIHAPTDSDIDKLPHINALPFRAYESIYNAFYRDQRNNPYILNGVADPNVYLPSKEGGSDSNDYDIRFRNWEQDYLTTAVPSPQQGNAPLVGITSSGVATFADDDGTKHTVKLTTADDGDTITGAEFTDNLPNSVSRAIVDIASSGISISDFRGVNAYQRWLEINMRRGLKYKDQILSHFGVEPSYAELDMPEFLGGATQFFDPSQVNQMSESEGSPLGSYAGQMSAVGANKHDITHYFDEHGYVIGIISIVPVPVYDQTMDKDWIKRSPLDYYFPEFGHLSFQPITYNEVAPFQAIKSGIDLNRTYGYQRPWYEYLQRTDTAHGDFRTTLRDFIIGRTFDAPPSLNASFLTVNPNQINNVFTVGTVEDSSGDKVRIQPFLGQLHFDLVMKRPIPLYGIPRLE